MSLKIIANIKIESRDNLNYIKNEALKLVEITRKEVGCLEYNLFQNYDNENELIMIETWEDDDTLSAHFSTKHLQNFLNILENIAQLTVTKSYLIV